MLESKFLILKYDMRVEAIVGFYPKDKAKRSQLIQVIILLALNITKYIVLTPRNMEEYRHIRINYIQFVVFKMNIFLSLKVILR